MAAESATPSGERWLRVLRGIEDGILALVLGTMILLASAQILLRNLFDGGLTWGDPMLRILVLWVGLLGALAAARDDNHISIDLVSRKLPEGGRAAARAATSLFTAGISALVAYHAARFTAMDFEARVTAFAGMPAWVFESIVPVAFGLLAARYALLLIVHLRALFTRAAQ